MFNPLAMFTNEIKKISFEDIQYSIKRPGDYILINTLPVNEQECLIKTTIDYQTEERVINELITQYKFKEKKLLIYGKHTCDNSVEKKYKQLMSIGFSNIYVYSGGLFEWLLLQDIYGVDEFPTTTKIIDILKYKPLVTLSIR